MSQTTISESQKMSLAEKLEEELRSIVGVTIWEGGKLVC